MKLTIIFARLLLTAALLYLVYKETGIATTLALWLVTVSHEVMAFTCSNLLESVRLLRNRL